MKHRHRNLKRLSAGLLLGTALLLSGCNETKAERGWNIPTDPQEKAAYDYAHSLKLPDSVPKPVPFNFTKARLKALWPGNPSVSDQYFEHLCNTEAGEYIFKTVENVEGVFQMRPRSAPGELDYDRYTPEEPTGLGYSNDVDSFGEFHVPSIYIQPMMGEYLFLERPMSVVSGGVMRYQRGLNERPPLGEQNGRQTWVPGKYGWGFRLPFMVVRTEVSTRKARYGFIWRGIKRKHDRYYSIGSGEYLVVDLDTNEVLAAKRRFKISGHDKDTPFRIWWGNARPCDNDVLWRKGLTPAPIPINQFVKKVLKPIPGLNDQYIPENYRRALKGEAK